MFPLCAIRIVIIRLSDSLLKLLCSSLFNYTFIFVSTLLLDSVGISGLIIYVLFLLWQYVYVLCRNVLHSSELVSRYSTYSFITGTVTSLSSGSFIWITWSCIFVHWSYCVSIALDLFDRSTVLYLLSPVSYFTWNWHSLLCKSFLLVLYVLRAVSMYNVTKLFFSSFDTYCYSFLFTTGLIAFGVFIRFYR